MLVPSTSSCITYSWPHFKLHIWECQLRTTIEFCNRGFMHNLDIGTTRIHQELSLVCNIIHPLRTMLLQSTESCVRIFGVQTAIMHSIRKTKVKMIFDVIPKLLNN